MVVIVKRPYVLLLVFLVAVSIIAQNSIAAAKEPNLVLTAVPIKDQVMIGEWAEFDVTIWNNQHLYDEIVLSIEEEGTQWSMVTRPSVDYLSAIKIAPRGRKLTRVLLKDIDLRRDENHPYSVELHARSRITGSEATVRLPIYLMPFDPAKMMWAANLSVDTHIPAIVDPRRTHSFKIDIKNNNYREYGSLDVALKGNLVDEKATIYLGRNEQKTVAFTVAFDEGLAPQKDVLTLTLSEGGNLLYQAKVHIEIAPYTTPFAKEVFTTERYLKLTEEIKLRNMQNVEATQRILRAAPFWKSLLTSTDPDATIESREDGRYYTWEITLDPGESTTLVITTNYRIPIYVFLLIGFGIFLFVMLRDPVLINKRAEMIKLHEGGITEFRIIIAVKNRRKQDIKGVRLIEKLPTLVTFVEGGGIGMVKPSKVIHQEKGTIMHWDMDLTSEEERLITYYIKTKLSILGGFRLPPATLRFDVDSKSVKVRSNELDVTT